MQADRVPPQCLNLSIKYVSHWTYLQGLRQLYQNFMDACIQKYPEYKILFRSDPNTNKVLFTQAKRVNSLMQKIQGNYICYERTEKRLILQNQKSFPIKCLLMGCSQKGPNALGQFGQGMKISMIVLLKAGIDIYIESGDYVYYPSIRPWSHNPLFENKYEHDVLYVKIMKNAQKSDKTKVIIDNLDSTKFQQFLYLSLALLDETKYQKINFGTSTLIIPNDPKLVGKIYKKGVRLQLHQSQNSRKFEHYSYDFNTIAVGRQRDCVNNVWDLYKLQSELHYNVLCLQLDKKYLVDNPHFKPKLRDHVNNIYRYLTQNNYQTHFFHTFSCKNKLVCDIIYQKFLQKNQKTELYPQYDSVTATVQRYLMLYGLKSQFYPVVNVSWQMWHSLIYSNKYRSIDKKVQQQIINKQVRQLNQDELQLLSRIKQKIVLVTPEVNQYNIKIKAFKQIYCCKDKNANIKTIYLNPERISQVDLMARQLCKMLLI